MTTRIPSHQLSSGLYVSGRPEQLNKERQPTMASRAVPYTGGDVKKSGELGKMFDIPSRPSSSSQHNSGSVRSGSNSGHQLTKSSNSGPILHPTGLITSGVQRVLRSGPLLEPSVSTGAGKTSYGNAVTNVGEEDATIGFKLSKGVMWVFGIVLFIALLVGVFMMATIKNAFILAVVAALFVPLLLLLTWNCFFRNKAFLGFLNRFPDAELRSAKDGQFVKVTGVVTCGSIPLESSYQRVPRCAYVSTELYEYKRWGGKSAKPKHCPFSWGLRYFEKHVADFYVSDFQSGLRALVKAGYGAKVAPFVKPTTVVDVTQENRELSPGFLQWLADRKLSADDRIMRLKEGYIKEGSTVSVMGIVQRHDNVLMIIPSPQPPSTGCQWLRCLVPTYIEGLILKCDESQNSDVIPV